MTFPDTKFMLPRLRAASVERAELVGPLVEDVLSVPLTVLSAPAGYGKTTLAAAVATRTAAAWLSLDPDDNDPRRFVAGLSTALGQELVTAEKDPDAVRRGVVALLNAIAKTNTPVVLVLDEWEVISDGSVAGHLEYLAEWAPPNLHLLLTTRQDPAIGLARLRARGLLAERGPNELRFTEADAEALLNGELRLGLPAAELVRIMHRTEGWPAGLRLLAASSVDSRRTGGRLPRAGDTDVFDFLADEVFDRQPTDIQRFLVETAVLSTMDGPACVAVTGREDATEILAGLAQRGLFVTEQGDQETYRYHPLFAQFLSRRLNRLPANERDALYQRAAAAESDPIAAARHLLAANDPQAAAERLASAGIDLVRLGRATSVREILGAIPADRPELLVLKGDLAFADGDLPTARAAFEQAGPVGPVAARLAETLVLQGEITAAAELIDRVLAGPLDRASRVRLQLTKAHVAQISGRYAAAEEAIGAGVNAATDRESITTAAAHLSPPLVLIRGAAEHLERFTGTARQQLTQGLPALQVASLESTVDLLRGRLEPALRGATETLAGYEQFGGAPPLLAYSLASLRLLAAGPMPLDIDELITDLARCAELLTTASFMYPNAWFVIGRAHWMRGRVEELATARARMDTGPAAPPGSQSVITVNRLSLDGLIALSHNDLTRANAALTEAVAHEDRLEVVNIYGSARIRLAYLRRRQGKPEEALRIASPALVECERSRTAGRILMEGTAAVSVLELARNSPFAAGLLRQLVTPVPDTTETLTPREMDVLRLLVAGATNKEIARRLVLGEETVKTHVSRVLRKLEVSTRAAAAARARDLGIS